MITVEMGMYTSADFDRKEVPLWMFLDYLELASNRNNNDDKIPRMYLAQHELLDELKPLVPTPALCEV